MKILMIGLGGIGQRHLRNLRSLLGDRLEVLAYRVRRNQDVLTDKLQFEAGSSLEEKYQITVFDNLDAALAENPEAAFICNPSSLHIPVATAAAKAGCHLFVEKPLSHNLEAVDELIQLVDQSGLVGFVAYQMRFHPCLKLAHSIVSEGSIGSIVAVRAEVGEFLPGWHSYEDYRQMYASRSDLGGGVILSQIHEMDYLYWLFGLPQRVFALGGHLSSLEIDVEDVASILMDCHGIPIHLHQDYVQRPPSRKLQIIGDSGKILVDFAALTVDQFDQNGSSLGVRSFAGFERNQLFLDEVTHFMACVEGREKPLVTLSDGKQSLRMALAAKESLTSGHVVNLS